MFQMIVESQFSAAHAICGYAGPCRNIHGHNYRVVVHLAGSELDALGMLIDYAVVKSELNQVLQRFDHTNLNDLDDFAERTTTSEELARLIYYRLQDTLLTTDDLRRRVRLTRVDIFETERQGVGFGDG